MTDELGGQCFLVTGDKDCRQLITDRVKVYNIRKNEVFDRDALQAEWGIAPEQVVDFQALVGDSVDNVPGVPLIGPEVRPAIARTIRHAGSRARPCRRSRRGEAEGEPAEVPRAGPA